MQKFSIYPSVARKYSIQERLAAIKAAGFDAVCLDFEQNAAATETSWENQVQLADRYGLPVENVHLTGTGMTAVWSEGDAGEAVIRRLIDELRRMGELGISVGVAHVTWGHGKPGGDFALGLRRYEQAAEAAEKYGVNLALENSVYPEYVHHLLSHIHSPNLGFCYDSGHESAFSPEESYLERYADRLIAMHLHDNDGVNDLHAMPFHGTIDWAAKAAQLKRCPLFSRMITLECSIEGKSLEDEFGAALAEAKKLAAL